MLGILLLPDGATFTADEAITWGTANKEYPKSYSGTDFTKCTAEQWNNLEAKGAVFLPAAGYKPDEANLWPNNAYYWSATEYSGSGSNGSITVIINGGSSTTVQKDANIVSVDKTFAQPSVNYAKYIRNAVRLVRRAE